MIKNCESDDCDGDIEDLGTAGFVITLPDGTQEYHNRHDRKCTKCNKRYDIHDCTCDADHCVNNENHHIDHDEDKKIKFLRSTQK